MAGSRERRVLLMDIQVVDLSLGLTMNRIEEHGKRVGVLAYALAQYLEYPEEVMVAMYAAGRWHDEGKTKMPIEMLVKPSKLSDKEFEQMKQHPVYSEHLAKLMGLPESIRQAILYHHEDYAGTGYPSKLKGEEIPYGARILRICDVFDALTEDRSYKKGISYKEALIIMDDDYRKGKYDPEFYMVFRKNHEEVEDYVKRSIGNVSRSLDWTVRGLHLSTVD